MDRVLELVLGKEGPQGMEAEMAYRLRERFAAAFGGMPFISDPDHVASELARIAGWGFDGVVFGFVNYLEELPFFAQEVLPRLERMDLRQPFRVNVDSDASARKLQARPARPGAAAF